MLLLWMTQLLALLFLLWGVGMVFLLLVDPRFIRRDGLVVAPFFGFAVISGLSHYLGKAGLSVHQFVWLLVVLALAAPFLWLLRGKPRPNLRHLWPVALLGCAAYVIAVIPLLRLGYLTTTGTTIDGLSYAVRSEYLQEAALASPDTYWGQPFYAWVASQIDVLRVGDVYLVAAIGELTGQRSYQLLTTTASLFYALTPVSLFVFCRRFLKMKARPSLLAAGCITIHNLLLWAVHDNFLSQVVGVSLIPVVLVYLAQAVRKPCWAAWLSAGVLLSALVSVYPVYGVVVTAILPLLLLQDWFVGPRSLRTLVGLARSGGLVLLLAFLLNAVAIGRAVTEVAFVGQLLDPDKSDRVGVGNILVYPPVQETVGLVSHVSTAYGLGFPAIPELVLWAISGLVVLCIGVGLWRLRGSVRFGAVAVLSVPLLLALQQRFGVNPPHGYPYGYFKAISVVALLMVPIWAHGLVALLGSRRLWLRVSAFGLCAVVLLLNGFHTTGTLNHVVADRIIVNQDLVEVVDGLRLAPDDAWVLLDLRPGLAQHWMGYLLKGYRIHYREPLFTQNVGTTPYPLPVFQAALVERALDTERGAGVIEEPWYTPDSYRALWGNARFELRLRTDVIVADLGAEVLEDEWLPQTDLVLSIQNEDQFSVRAAGEVLVTVPLAGKPSRAVLTVLVPPPGSHLCVGDDCLDLEPGVWNYEAATGEGADEVISLRNAGQTPIYPHRIKVYGDAVSPNLGVWVRRPDGVAWVTREASGTLVTFDATVLPPQGANVTLRLGLHVYDPRQSKLLGVWGLDFAGDRGLQHGILQVDFGNLQASGEVEGVEQPTDLGPFQVDVGDFEVQLVWWRLDGAVALGLHRPCRVIRSPSAGIEVECSVPIPPTFVPAR